MIEEIAKHHKKWIGYAKKIGCGDYSEDIVQEMYIKIIRFNPTEIIVDGKIQDGYIYIILQNTYLDYLRKKNENFSDFDITNDEKIRYNNETDFDDFIEWLENEQEQWKWSHKVLFDMYYQTDKSMRQIGREHHISFVGISRLLKKIREDIKQKYGKQNKIKTL